MASADEDFQPLRRADYVIEEFALQALAQEFLGCVYYLTGGEHFVTYYEQHPDGDAVLRGKFNTALAKYRRVPA